eukprot:scaffold7052_cov254-Pinguiococcus_pyrenoidosus.AAC.117
MGYGAGCAQGNVVGAAGEVSAGKCVGLKLRCSARDIPLLPSPSRESARLPKLSTRIRLRGQGSSFC